MDYGTKIVTKSIRNRAGDAEVFRERSGAHREATCLKTLGKCLDIGSHFGTSFGRKSEKYPSKKHAKNNANEYIILIPKSSQNDAEIGQEMTGNQ